MNWYSRRGGRDRFPRYVSVAERRENAQKQIAKLNKGGQLTNPIIIDGRTIAKTFWGKAWCTNLELYSDYENRLPRGRTYVRNGSVMDLQVSAGKITALVTGSSMYKVNITISKVASEKWNSIVNDCAGKIDSLIELLQGKFSKAVMEIITNRDKGLFPSPSEIKLNCSCPDWADMCKHVAAVLYGVGARLDNKPEELFLLRQADHIELISVAGTASLVSTEEDVSDVILADTDLSSLFGIDMGSTTENNQLNELIIEADKPVLLIKKQKKKGASSPIKKKSKTKKTKEKVEVKKRTSIKKKTQKKSKSIPMKKPVKKIKKSVKNKKAHTKKTVKKKK